MPRVLIAALFVLAFSARAEWHPAAGPLMTKWAADVKPDNALPEYPRPQMVREKWLNLNGLWNYSLPKDAAEAEAFLLKKEVTDQILVPFPLESALSGVMKRSERIAYRRTFEVPKDWTGQRVLLNFGAVNWESVVYVNGKNLGTHKGGYDPFSYDITDALKEGANELVVTAFNPANKGEQPRGKQVVNPGGIFYLPSTGIWQTVWLEPVPKRYIRNIVLNTDVDKKKLSVSLEIAGDPALATITVDVAGNAAMNPPQMDTDANAAFVLDAKALELWSPSSPKLYDLTLTLRVGGNVDTVKSYFAMRKISLGKDNGVNKILLNDKFVFQMGELDQGFWPDGLYTAPTDAALKFDIEAAKDLGFNMIRKHVKVEPQRWYYWADKLGVLVWQDMPSGEHAQGKKGDRTDEGKKQHELELQRMIENLRNHPSIVVWVVFNEGWGQYDTERLTDWVKKFDPSRLTNNASGWTDKKCGDMIDMHNYPGPGCPPPEEKRAAVLGEFGGIGFVAEGHQWVKSDKNWGYNGLQKTSDGLARRYEQLLRKTYGLVETPGLSAAVYTQITDVETESNGLLAYDRTPKTDAARIRAANRGELKPVTIVNIVETSEKTAHNWRYTTDKPDDNWFKIDFDDSKWKEGPAGFGTANTPGAVVRTTWNTADIWIRRTVQIEAGDFDHALLRCYHDEDVEVFINGVLAAKVPGYAAEYTEFEITPEGRKALKPGANVIAAKCHQTKGGQNIDLGIVNEK